MDYAALYAAAIVGALVFVGAYLVLLAEANPFVRASKRVRAFTQKLRRAGVARAKPRLRSKSETRERGIRVSKEMAGFLDMLTLGLGAGLSFDSSLDLYCKRCDTELSKLLWDCMLQWQMGVKSRQDALEVMADELKVQSVTRFVSTVSEALAFGSPLSATLERQAKVIRHEQRALIEEEIERVPIKMLIPLGTLIVPAMLLAILGPLLGPAIGMA